MKRTSNAKLTVREAWDKFYDTSDLTPNAINTARHMFTLWEKLSGNPTVGEIDNAALSAFRQAAVKAEYSPSTINTCWNRLRAVLRRIGPAFTGNPWGLGIIETVPAMKPVRVIHARPNVVSLGDLSRVYVACRHATAPRTGIAASDWWRALLVVAYTTGLRRCDLFALQWDQIDLDSGVMEFTASKTRKSDRWPLHPVAVAHLDRIKRADDGRVFRGLYNRGTSGLYQILRPIQDLAGVDRFTLHDLRRTGASQIEAICSGLGPEFLQHAPRSVSDVSYLNRYESLKAALEKLPLPAGFRAGPQTAARQESKARAERVEMRQEDFHVPTGPNPGDWGFRFGQFAYHGKWFPLPSSMRVAVLRELATSPEPVEQRRLIEVAKAANPGSKMASQKTISVLVSDVRERLRKCLGLSPDIDPIPCVQRIPPAWTLWIPQA